MLHIITPIYRFNLLEQVYNSILMNDDITWHISKSNKREELDYDFLKKDNRVRLYNVDCEDEEAFKKRQYVLEKIDSGYFCFLDDDIQMFGWNMYMTPVEAAQGLMLMQNFPLFNEDLTEEYKDLTTNNYFK